MRATIWGCRAIQRTSASVGRVDRPNIDERTAGIIQTRDRDRRHNNAGPRRTAGSSRCRATGRLGGPPQPTRAVGRGRRPTRCSGPPRTLRITHTRWPRERFLPGGGTGGSRPFLPPERALRRTRGGGNPACSEQLAARSRVAPSGPSGHLPLRGRRRRVPSAPCPTPSPP